MIIDALKRPFPYTSYILEPGQTQLSLWEKLGLVTLTAQAEYWRFPRGRQPLDRVEPCSPTQGQRPHWAFINFLLHTHATFTIRKFPANNVNSSGQEDEAKTGTAMPLNDSVGALIFLREDFQELHRHDPHPKASGGRTKEGP